MPKLFKCKNNNDIIFNEMQKPKSFFKRNNGLMFKEKLKPNQAMMITGCNCIHTFFMKFNIDVIYLNKMNEIKKIKKDIRPNRLTLPVIGAWSVIECTSGNNKIAQLKIGDKLIVYS